VQLVGCGQQHALAHQRIERLGTGLGRIEQLGVDVRHLLAHALHLLLVAGIPLGLGDGLARHLGHGGVAPLGHAAVALDAKDDERRQDQKQDQAQEQPVVFADEIEHVDSLWVGVRIGSL